MQDVKAEIIEVSPGLAQQWLDKNEKNRGVSEIAVKRYAKAMKDGRWKLNGEAVKIAKDGMLLDGQHRLSAVIRANIVIPMMVITGLPRDTFETMDTGNKRTGGDVLTIKYDVPRNSGWVIAAAARCINMFSENGVYTGLTQRFSSIDNDDVLKIVAKNQGLIRAFSIMRKMTDVQKMMPLSLATALYYLFCKTDLSKADSFFFYLNSGADLKLDDPILTLRRRLTSFQGQRKRAEEILPYVTKAWILSLENKTVSSLRIEDDFIPKTRIK